MSNALVEIARIALAVALQTLVPLVIGLLALRLARRSQTTIRCLLARATLGGVALSLCLAPLLAGKAPAIWHFSMGEAASSRSVSPQPVAAVPELASPSVDNESAPTVSTQELPPAVESPQNEAVSSVAPTPLLPEKAIDVSPANPVTAPRLSFVPDISLIYGIVVAGWLVGTVALLGWLFVGSLILLRLKRGAVPVEAGRVLAIRNELCALNKVPRPPLLESAHVQSPFLCGLWRPCIVLPAGCEELETETKRAILAHEIAHLQRRDLWWQMGARYLVALLWWQPLLWWLSRELEAAQEDCCDQAVLVAGCAPQSYARCLLDLAERWPLRRVERVAALGVTPSRSALGRRVRLILENRRQVAPSRFTRWGLAAAMLGCGLSSPLLVAAENALPDAVSAAPQLTPQFLRQKEEVLAVAFSPDGKQVAEGGSGGLIQVYEVATGHMWHSVRGKSRQITALAWSPDGQFLANSLGELWDTHAWHVSPKRIFTLSQTPPHDNRFNTSCSWSSDSRLLASGGGYRTIMRRTGSGWQTLRNQVTGDWIYDMQFSPDGRFLAEGRMNGWNVWDGRTLRQNTPLKDARASALAQYRQSQSPEYQALVKQYMAMARLKMSDQDRRAAMASLTEKMWAYETFTPVTKIAFSPNSQMLAVAHRGRAKVGLPDKNGKIVVWDTTKWKIKHQFVFPGGSVSALAWSPDSLRLAGGERPMHGNRKPEIKIWDVSQGQLLETLKGHSADITSLAWSPDGTVLASGGEDKALCLWPVTKMLPVVAGVAADPTKLSSPLDRSTPEAALTSFYRALNAGNADNASDLLWDRPIGGVDFAGVRKSIDEVRDNDLKLNLTNLQITTTGNEAKARFSINSRLSPSQLAQLSLKRIAWGEVRADLRRDAAGWQLYDEPLPAVLGGAEIVGRVVDEKGQPVANVGVETYSRGFSQRPLTPVVTSRLKALSSSREMKQRLLARTQGTHNRTRADGSFRLTGLTSGDYVVRITTNAPREGWKPDQDFSLPSGYYASSQHGVTLTEGQRASIPEMLLKRGVVVRGRVVDQKTGQGLYDLTVSAWNPPLGSTNASWIYQPWERRVYITKAKTGRNGHFEVTLPPGQQALRISGRNEIPSANIRSAGTTYGITPEVEAVLNNKPWPLQRSTRPLYGELLRFQGQAGEVVTVKLSLPRAPNTAR